ncbi:MAG: hypothetical protein IJA32_12335 [Lachnospiraceae bacterium]|nr:hypothetical protein [Lachnospiraceae bacterium]
MVEERFLGKPILTPDSTEEEIEKCFNEYYFSEEEEEDIRRALKSGEAVYWGEVCYARAEDELAEIYLRIWNKLEKIESKNFKIIDGELGY